MVKLAISVNQLSKKYALGDERTASFRETFNKLWRKKSTQREFWALKDINFEIEHGQAIGIIGRNGAGKSTLLKILSRITFPTHGKAEIYGRVSSLLEVGTGFHPELTGRENIYLNGTILGMRRREVKEKFDEIVAFSGVEKFIDTSIKHYSSGMKVRLAFSVAAHLEPEILLIDEVLAVGDYEFQKKSLTKMDSVARSQGRTVLFVSHQLQAIEKLCPTTILLDRGNILVHGNTQEVLKRYRDNGVHATKMNWVNPQPSQNAIALQRIDIAINGTQPFLKLEICCVFSSNSGHRPAFLAFDIVNSFGNTILQAIPESKPFLMYKKGETLCKVVIDLPPLIPDVYRVSVWVGPENTFTYTWDREIVEFEIIASPLQDRTYPHSPNNGSIIPFSRIIYG